MSSVRQSPFITAAKATFNPLSMPQEYKNAGNTLGAWYKGEAISWTNPTRGNTKELSTTAKTAIIAFPILKTIACIAAIAAIVFIAIPIKSYLIASAATFGSALFLAFLAKYLRDAERFEMLTSAGKK